MARPEPTLDVEREFFANGARIVAGMDEVGRGAIAGPVTIGVVAIDANVGEIPTGLRDSKLMTPKRREAMVPVAKEWGIAWATGSATAAEIDKFGIVTSLGLAASRALQNLDIMRHIFHLMPASVLLRCTLVCRSFRATIDTGVTGEFERHLRWTGFFMDKWASTNGALCCVDFDAELSVLRASVHVAQQAVQYMWRLNVIPKVKNYVYMHMRMYLPLAHVNVSGDPKRIERLQAQGDVSIDVRKWQIVETQQDGDSTGAVPGSLGRLQLKAVWFAHNSPVKLQVDHNILVDFHNVPVGPQALNYRSLCVMRCVLVCMHATSEVLSGKAWMSNRRITEFCARYATRRCTCR
jgi:hypothetical protein